MSLSFIPMNHSDRQTNVLDRLCHPPSVGFSKTMWSPVLVTIFTKPSARVGYYTRSIFKRSLTGFNSEFSFSWTSCLTKAKEPSLPDYLPISKGRIIGFIPFPRVLVLCEMQSVSSRIWTRVAAFISYDDNHYTTGTRVSHRAKATIRKRYQHSTTLGWFYRLEVSDQATVFSLGVTSRCHTYRS